MLKLIKCLLWGTKKEMEEKHGEVVEQILCVEFRNNVYIKFPN